MQRGLAPPRQIHWLNLAPVLSVLTILCLTPPPSVADHAHCLCTQGSCPQITCVFRALPPNNPACERPLLVVGLCKWEIFRESQLVFVLSSVLQSSVFCQLSGIVVHGPSLEGGATVQTLGKGLPGGGFWRCLMNLYPD